MNQETREIIALLGSVSVRLDAVNEKLDDMDSRVSEIEKMAQKYRGGFLTILSLGAFAGWVMSNLDWIKHLFAVR